MEKMNVPVPEDFRKTWDEVRECASLIREGKAEIVAVTRKDGSIYRYTKRR